VPVSAAGWSSLVARWAHNPKVEGSNPSPATKEIKGLRRAAQPRFLFCARSVPVRIRPGRRKPSAEFPPHGHLSRLAWATQSRRTWSFRCRSFLRRAVNAGNSATAQAMLSRAPRIFGSIVTNRTQVGRAVDPDGCCFQNRLTTGLHHPPRSTAALIQVPFAPPLFLRQGSRAALCRSRR
jgi:hypothetical protein